MIKLLDSLFLRKWKSKLITLFMAVLLWGYVQNQKIAVLTLNIPLEYKNLAENLSFVKEPPRFVKISLRGRQDYMKFSTNNLKAEVNLIDAKLSTDSAAIFFDEGQLPENVKMVNPPERIAIKLDEIVSKRVKIEASFSGQLPPGFKRGNLSIVPNLVEVSGPRVITEGINSVNLDKIDLSNLRATIRRKVAIVLENKVLKVKPEFVDLQLFIFSEVNTVEKSFDVARITPLNLDPALRVFFSVKSVRVLLQGNSGIIENLDLKDIEATVNLEGTFYNKKTGNINPFETENNIPIQIKLLKDTDKIAVSNIYPDSLTVRFEVKEEYRIKKEEP